MKKYSVVAVSVLAVMAAGFLAGCGEGVNNVSNFPQTAAEVKAIYDSSPQILENPLAPGATANPDVKITLTIINNDPNQPYLAPIYNVTIVYKDREIYNKANGWGTYLADGFTKSGKYLLFIREYPYGEYAGISKIFINGEPVDLTAAGAVADIKEFDASWLILVSQYGSIRSAEILSSWSMYNLDTGELKRFGEYGLFGSSH